MSATATGLTSQAGLIPVVKYLQRIGFEKIVGYTQAAHMRAEQTVNKQHLKQSQAEYKAFNALAKRSFACVADAEAALAHLHKTLKVVALLEPHVRRSGMIQRQWAPL